MEEQRKEEIEELEKQEETVQEEAGVIEPEEEPVSYTHLYSVNGH